MWQHGRRWTDERQAPHRELGSCTSRHLRYVDHGQSVPHCSSAIRARPAITPHLEMQACPYKLQQVRLLGSEEAGEHHQPSPLTLESCREAAAPPEEASPQEAAVKVLHGFTDSARNFQVQLAKAVHSPGRSSRSHQEAAGPTSFPARAAAAYLALVLRDNLSQPQAPVGPHPRVKLSQCQGLCNEPTVTSSGSTSPQGHPELDKVTAVPRIVW